MTCARPEIIDSPSPKHFFARLTAWKNSIEPDFSVRKAAAHLRRCSPALVSLVLQGKRRLTIDRVEDFSQLFDLTMTEKELLKAWCRNTSGLVSESFDVKALKDTVVQRQPKNHLLTDWLNVYVKDAARLKGFKPDVDVIYTLFAGVFSRERIRRSLSFLLHEGFLRRTLDGRVVENENIVYTTHELPNSKIRAFHKQALELAKKAIDLYPTHKRVAWTLVLPLNSESQAELKQMLNEFQERLIAFAESHAKDDKELFQVVLNLSPIGGNFDKEH